MTNRGNVVSAYKIFSILEELANNDGHMKLTTISENLNFPVSTTHRFLNSLIELGYINQHPDTGEYCLGVKLLSLTNSVLKNLDLRKIAHPFLVNLRDKTGETANLVVLDSDEALYIEKVESKASVRVFSMIGRRAPLHATGVGKVFLADLAWSDVLKILEEKGMEKLTRHTITNPDELMEELNEVRKKGYAFDREECEEGAMCIAAPVKNHTGKTIACISISAPKVRFNQEKLPKFINILIFNAEQLSKSLGYVPRVIT